MSIILMCLLNADTYSINSLYRDFVKELKERGK